jgi:hypothetical protein
MSPHRLGLLAYWHSGGGIESRSGPLSRRRALQLVRFHLGEMVAALERRDNDAARFSAGSSLDLASAIVAADAWKAAAASAVRAPGENTAVWLRKA